MLEMSWINPILQLYSQVTDCFGNVIVKRINMRLFDLLARFHYILNLPRIYVARTKAMIDSFARLYFFLIRLKYMLNEYARTFIHY